MLSKGPLTEKYISIEKFFYITSYLVPKWYYIINIPKE